MSPVMPPSADQSVKPDMQPVRAGAGETRGAATEALKGMDPFIIDIAQGEVGHVEMFSPPAGRTACLPCSRPEPKKGELVAERCSSPASMLPVKYHHSVRYSLWGPWSAGKMNSRGSPTRAKAWAGSPPQYVSDGNRFITVPFTPFGTAGHCKDCRQDKYYLHEFHEFTP